MEGDDVTRGVTNHLAAVRTWAVNWLAGQDAAAAAACLDANYELQIGPFTLGPRSAYIEATLGQLERYPGLGVTVHDILTDGQHTVVRLSEHGPSTRHDGAVASWRVVAVFEHAEDRIVRGWAEEDYWARRRQLTADLADPIDPPAAAPWSTTAQEPEPGVADAVRQWVAAGAPALPGLLRDDEDLVDSYELPFEASSGSIDVLVVSGRKAGFHAVIEGSVGDTPLRLPVAGLVTVAADGKLTGHLVTDRLGLPKTETTAG